MADDNKPLTESEDREALAAEFALGLLESDEAKAATQRLKTDAEFAQAVQDWQERFAAMAEKLTPVMPPARAWQTIRERLGHGTAPLTEDPASPGVSWWRRPIGLFAAMAAAAAIAAFIWLPQQTSTPDQEVTYQAQLETEDKAVALTARLVGRNLQVDLEKGSAAEGRDLEIWWIAGADATPVSVGLVPKEGSATLDIPDDLTLQDGIKIALSDEPEGGSPTGQATGDIVAISDLQQL